MSDMQPTQDDGPHTTVDEVAAALVVSPATVRLWLREGKLPARRNQGRWMIRRADVLDFARAREQADHVDLGDLD